MKFLLLLISFFCFTQVFSQTFKVGISTEFKPRDLFLNVNGSFQKENHQVGLVYGLGIQRAFVQNHYFPQLSVNYDYRFLNRDLFQLFATNTFSYSTMRLGRTTHQRLHVLEGYIGFSYEIGNKIRFRNSILGGLYSELISPKPAYFVRKLNLGYQFTIGVLYAF